MSYLVRKRKIQEKKNLTVAINMRLIAPDWKKAGTIYPIELIVGCTIAVIVGEDRLERQKKEYYFLGSRNIINQIFAYRGHCIHANIFEVSFTRSFGKRRQDSCSQSNGKAH